MSWIERSRFFRVVILLTLCGYSSVAYARVQSKLPPLAASDRDDSVTGLKAINLSVHYPLQKVYRMTSPFGWRFHPVKKIRKHHNGIDIGAPHGVPVLAVAPGTVVFANFTGGGGNQVAIEHNGTYRTWYAHLSKMVVTVGQRVEPGTIIGYVGATGRLVTGPHLHFELRRREDASWKPIDPVAYLRRTIPLPSTPIPPSVNDTSFQEDIPDCDDVLWGKCKETSPPTPELPQTCDNVLWGNCKDFEKNMKLELEGKKMKLYRKH